ncbi:MAG: PDZ domain-containing protein [Planctomycetota bacterium]|nr:MAG: PDZ domain-containing protein [Planctomycetota bacterium]
MALTVRMKAARRAIALVFPAVLLCFLFASAAVAQDDSPDVAEKPAERPEADSDADLPEVFFKAAPEGLADLREMERHVRSLVKSLTECTVGVQIGAAQGSGVIISEDGYILTAAHVSGRPGRPAEVILHDGTRVSATTLGRDRTLDAGLMKIDGDRSDWPHVEMAEQDTIDNGDWCLTTGHPGGYQEGRAPVFRMGRVIFASARVLQTDCELVGGDSGGPVFDMAGRVIGINSRIGEETEMNFHVPIAAFRGSWDRLAASESFRSHSGALLGVTGQPHEKGFEITRVYEDEPAAEAGVQVGDILVTFDARKVAGIDQLRELVGRQPPGKEVQLELIRDGEVVEITVKLGIRWD